METTNLKHEAVIFLDIDGVLTHNSFRGMCQDLNKPFDLVDPSKLWLMSKIQKEYPYVRFVISSSWRIGATKEKIEKVFRDSGFELKLHDRWCTSSFSKATEEMYLKWKNYKDSFLSPEHLSTTGSPKVDFYSEEIQKTLSNRGWEIVDWLTKQPKDTITLYISIDDDADFEPITSYIHVKDGEMLGGFHVKHYQELEYFFLRNEVIMHGDYSVFNGGEYFDKNRYDNLVDYTNKFEKVYQIHNIIPYNQYSQRFKAAIDLYRNILLVIENKELFKYLKIEQYGNEGSRGKKDISECLSETYYIECVFDENQSISQTCKRQYSEFCSRIYNPFSDLFRDNVNYPNISYINTRNRFPIGHFGDVTIITLSFDEIGKSRICTFIFKGL